MILRNKSLALFALTAAVLLNSVQGLIDLYGDPVNNNPTGNYPLDMCEGDCDNDSQCRGCMICYQFESVNSPLPPGCSGSIYNHPTAGVYDYCAEPANHIGCYTNTIPIDLFGDPIDNQPTHPLARCEGDCDFDYQCIGCMVCYQFESVNSPLPPGCSGSIYNHPTAGVYDYCAEPEDNLGCLSGFTPPDDDEDDAEGSGDPHIKTWSGDWFDYSGECDLKLVHVPKIDGKLDLDIDARTTIRYGYSFIESAAIRIGLDTLEVSSWGEYAVNGVSDAFLVGPGAPTSGLRKARVVTSLGGYKIYHTVVSKIQHKYDIVLAPGNNITVANHKDMVSVKFIHGHISALKDVSGLFGNYRGEMIGRDGVSKFDITKDMNAIGQEWQVRDDEPMLFRTARYPQYPEACILPRTGQKEYHHLGLRVTEEAAKLACDHLRVDEHAFANCVYDVTATNDLELAEGGPM